MGSKAKDLLLGGTVPIEINQTSNDTLLSNAKKAFFELRAKNVPVVLATDDDGIWRCESADRRYVSVANEFYRAIMSDRPDERLVAQDIDKIVAETRDSAFDRAAASKYF